MKKTGKDWQTGNNRGKIGLENVCKGEGSMKLNTGKGVHQQNRNGNQADHDRAYSRIHTPGGE